MKRHPDVVECEIHPGHPVAPCFPCSKARHPGGLPFQEEREAISRAACSFVETPFMRRGRTREGIDCIGLVKLAGDAAGMKVRDALELPLDVSADQFHDELVQRFDQIPISEAVMGDLVETQWGKLRHVGILVRGGAIAQASLTAEKTTVHYLGPHEAARIVAAFRFRELTAHG